MSRVSNLRRNPLTSDITWIPPYSLNLTEVDPDIAYRVDVYNITCGKEDLLVHNYTVTEPYYINTSILQRSDLFKIGVTPMSNVQGALNGMKQTITGMYS